MCLLWWLLRRFRVLYVPLGAVRRAARHSATSSNCAPKAQAKPSQAKPKTCRDSVQAQLIIGQRASSKNKKQNKRLWTQTWQSAIASQVNLKAHTQRGVSSNRVQQQQANPLRQIISPNPKPKPSQSRLDPGICERIASLAAPAATIDLKKNKNVEHFFLIENFVNF